jgi:hypothetical protein
VNYKVKIFIFAPLLDFGYASKPKNSASGALRLFARHYSSSIEYPVFFCILRLGDFLGNH